MLKRLSIFLLMAGLFVLPGGVAVEAQEGDTLTHVVQPGENLFRIALRYGVELDALAQANNIVDRTRILAGQTLVIPGLSVPDDGDSVVNPLIAGTPTTHIVQPGESVTIIANQYGLTVEQLLQSNDIANPNRIYRGQELTVWTTESVNAPAEAAEGPAVEAVPVESSVRHVVRRGETLGTIARQYGVTWSDIASANGIVNADRVLVGQELIIPGVSAAADAGLIENAAYAPSPTITDGRQIIVDLSDSRIYAYEDGALVYDAIVSTGLPATPTVQGDFKVYHRLRSQTMSGPGYYLPNVEYVQYFYQGYAIHGTYWHNNFGQPMSHGCVNLTNADAAWFYEFGEIGTPVRVQL